MTGWHGQIALDHVAHRKRDSWGGVRRIRTRILPQVANVLRKEQEEGCLRQNTMNDHLTAIESRGLAGQVPRVFQLYDRYLCAIAASHRDVTLHCLHAYPSSASAITRLETNQHVCRGVNQRGSELPPQSHHITASHFSGPRPPILS